LKFSVCNVSVTAILSQVLRLNRILSWGESRSMHFGTVSHSHPFAFRRPLNLLAHLVSVAASPSQIQYLNQIRCCVKSVSFQTRLRFLIIRGGTVVPTPLVLGIVLSTFLGVLWNDFGGFSPFSTLREWLAMLTNQIDNLLVWEMPFNRSTRTRIGSLSYTAEHRANWMKTSSAFVDVQFDLSGDKLHLLKTSLP
jgi:hypothetical protein